MARYTSRILQNDSIRLLDFIHGLFETRTHTLAALYTLVGIDLRQPEPHLADGLPGAKVDERAAMVLRTTVFVYYDWHIFFSSFLYTKVEPAVGLSAPVDTTFVSVYKITFSFLILLMVNSQIMRKSCQKRFKQN